MKPDRLTDERLAAIRKDSRMARVCCAFEDRTLLLAEVDHHRETLRYVLDVIDSGMSWTESRRDMLRKREPGLFGDDAWDHDGGRPRNPDLLAAAAMGDDDAP